MLSPGQGPNVNPFLDTSTWKRSEWSLVSADSQCKRKRDWPQVLAGSPPLPAPSTPPPAPSPSKFIASSVKKLPFNNNFKVKKDWSTVTTSASPSSNGAKQDYSPPSPHRHLNGTATTKLTGNSKEEAVEDIMAQSKKPRPLRDHGKTKVGSQSDHSLSRTLSLSCVTYEPDHSSSLPYENAIKVFESSNRVEYLIPRPLHSPSPPGSADFKESIKPVRRGQTSYASGCAQTTTSTKNFITEVSSRYCPANEDRDRIQLSNSKPHCAEQPVSRPITVDPFQILSGYRDKLEPASSLPERSTFPRIESCMPTSKFSDMDIVIGLTSEAVPEFSMPPAITSTSDFTFPSLIGYPGSNLCRISAAQSPLRGGVSQFENASLCAASLGARLQGQNPLRLFENF